MNGGIVLKPVKIEEGKPYGRIEERFDRWCCRLSLPKNASEKVWPHIDFRIPDKPGVPPTGFMCFTISGSKSPRSAANPAVKVLKNGKEVGRFGVGLNYVPVRKGDTVSIQFVSYGYLPEWTETCLSKRVMLSIRPPHKPPLYHPVGPKLPEWKLPPIMYPEHTAEISLFVGGVVAGLIIGKLLRWW